MNSVFGQKTTTAIHQVTRLLASIQDEHHLNEFIEEFMHRIRFIGVQNIYPYVLPPIFNNLCALICHFYNHKEPTETVYSFAEFMTLERLTPSVFSSLMEKITERYLVSVFKVQRVFAAKDPLVVTDSASCLSSMNFWSLSDTSTSWALLSPTGDFLWSDQRTRCLLEIKSENLRNKNLFKMMIPVSRQFIVSRYGESIFEPSRVSVSFNYIIYSSSSFYKFLKSVQRMNFRSPQSFQRHQRAKAHKRAIFFQYLKSLTSTATLVNVAFSFQDIVGLDTQSPLLEHIMGLLADKQCSLSGGQLWHKLEYDSSLVINVPLVFLKTAISVNLPSYDFQKMSADPKILKFDKRILKHVTSSKPKRAPLRQSQ